jgi:hypothetical protein
MLIFKIDLAVGGILRLDDERARLAESLVCDTVRATHCATRRTTGRAV